MKLIRLLKQITAIIALYTLQTKSIRYMWQEDSISRVRLSDRLLHAECVNVNAYNFQ